MLILNGARKQVVLSTSFEYIWFSKPGLNNLITKWWLAKSPKNKEFSVRQQRPLCLYIVINIRMDPLNPKAGMNVHSYIKTSLHFYLLSQHEETIIFESSSSRSTKPRRWSLKAQKKAQMQDQKIGIGITPQPAAPCPFRKSRGRSHILRKNWKSCFFWTQPHKVHGIARCIWNQGDYFQASFNDHLLNVKKTLPHRPAFGIVSQKKRLKSFIYAIIKLPNQHILIFKYL